MRSIPIVLFLLCLTADYGLADIIRDNNNITAPPLYADDAEGCTAELIFKAVAAIDNHAYVVVTGPSGSKLELRGGPEIGGLTGNPQNCRATGHKWGTVAAYVGKHGELAQGVFSPDGNVSAPSAKVTLGSGAQSNICGMANCMMKVMHSLGASCKNYLLGIAKMRNSNTIVSTALAACGVPDPRPTELDAAGWGQSWD